MNRKQRMDTMWKTTALALLTATIMAGSMQQPASAQGYGYGNGYGNYNYNPNNYYERQRADEIGRAQAAEELRRHGYRGGCSIGSLLRNGYGQVFDPVTQQWLDPTSPQAHLACIHQSQVDEQQGYVPPPRYGYGYGRR